MVSQNSLLVTLVKLVDRLPMPALAAKRGRGHPKVYSERLSLKALVIMIVRHLHKINELLSVLAQPTAEMATLRALLHEQGSFPTRRTWERRLKAIPQTLPAQIGCLGRHLVELIHPWASAGRAVAIDSTSLRPLCCARFPPKSASSWEIAITTRQICMRTVRKPIGC